ncbi:MAG: hypothetical protein JO001_29455 [Alphaproteobacteria bacterium]|nr:hypothetical protein [Alphaproteobacteria bacterium]
MSHTTQSVAVPLRKATQDIEDPGTVRLGDAMITAPFPPLRRPDERVADPGKVRLGDAMITAQFSSRN